jgi:hypothetical protein
MAPYAFARKARPHAFTAAKKQEKPAIAHAPGTPQNKGGKTFRPGHTLP